MSLCQIYPSILPEITISHSFHVQKAGLAQSSTTTASEPNTSEKPKKKGGKNKTKKKKSKPKSNQNINPNAILPKNKGNTKTKKKKKNTKKAKTQTNIKLNDTKKKKKNTNNNSKANTSERGRARTTIDKKKPKQSKSKSKPRFKIKPKDKSKQNNTNNIVLNSISYSPSKPAVEEKKDESPSKPKPKKKRFPWANWAIDRGTESDVEDDSGPTHRQRRSSLGSVREFHIARAKRARIKTPVKPSPKNKTVIIKDDDLDKINNISGKKGGAHRKKKKSKKKKNKMDKWDKISSNTADRHNVDGVDIYNPEAMKKERRKKKEAQKFKIVPKHHVKRSSLPTYQSIRKNNPQLKFYVQKETQRNLASLLDQPEKRKKSKRLRNLSRKGFDLHINRRYRLEDGRVGICKYKGRTEFGKSSEDWIGLGMFLKRFSYYNMYTNPI